MQKSHNTVIGLLFLGVCGTWCLTWRGKQPESVWE